ncbi:MAG: hypothetical protein ACLQFR_17930 [Streptosporangiaceae bacterium]
MAEGWVWDESLFSGNSAFRGVGSCGTGHFQAAATTVREIDSWVWREWMD